MRMRTSMTSTRRPGGDVQCLRRECAVSRQVVAQAANLEFPPRRRPSAQPSPGRCAGSSHMIEDTRAITATQTCSASASTASPGTTERPAPKAAVPATPALPCSSAWRRRRGPGTPKISAWAAAGWRECPVPLAGRRWGSARYPGSRKMSGGYCIMPRAALRAPVRCDIDDHGGHRVRRTDRRILATRAVTSTSR